MRAICTRLVERANERGGHDNITVIAVRFDGEALRASRDGDRFGYTTFPLAGTLNDDVRESVPASRPTLRSDPTPAFGTPVPSRAMLQEAVGRAPAPDDRARLGAPEPVIEERRRAVQPVFMLLGLIALLAVAWFVFDLVN
jgi:protein phosphatase